MLTSSQQKQLRNLPEHLRQQARERMLKTHAAKVVAAQKAKIDGTEKESKARHPIYDRIHQQQIKDIIREDLGEAFELYYNIALETGWRVQDILDLTFDNLKDDGYLQITINKQTRAVLTRGERKVQRDWVNKLKQDAYKADDKELYIELDNLECPSSIIAYLDEDSFQSYTDELDAALATATANKKTDRKPLSKETLAMIEELRQVSDEEFIFSRRVCVPNSKRTRNMKGAISRTTLWSKLKEVFDKFSSLVEHNFKLSAYSLRKTFSYNRYRDAEEAGKNGIAIVQELFGHSDPSITRRYLCLGTDADKLNLAAVGR